MRHGRCVVGDSYGTTDTQGNVQVCESSFRKDLWGTRSNCRNACTLCPENWWMTMNEHEAKQGKDGTTPIREDGLWTA